MNQNVKLELETDRKNQINQSPQGVPTFLSKTYEILENLNYYDVVSWTKNGQGFVVKKVKEFSQKILPMHFRHSNYSSFVRQLNMYDFHKMRQDNQENAFKNVLFRRGSKHLLRDIQRKDYKKNKQIRVQNKYNQSQYSVKNEGKQNEKNILKEVETQLQLNLEFTNKMNKNYQSTLEILKSEMGSLQQFQNKIQSLNKYNHQQNSDTNITIAQKFWLIDQIFNMKRTNSLVQFKIQAFSDEWENFIEKKSSKWMIFSQQELRSSPNLFINNNMKKITQIPTCVSQNLSLGFLPVQQTTQI